MLSSLSSFLEIKPLVGVHELYLLDVLPDPEGHVLHGALHELLVLLKALAYVGSVLGHFLFCLVVRRSVEQCYYF